MQRRAGVVLNISAKFWRNSRPARRAVGHRAQAPEDVDAIRAANRLDLELYDAVRAAFHLQVQSARRHGGPEVALLLEAARNGTLPPCRDSPWGGA